MDRAVATHPDPELRRLIALRMSQLSTNYARDRLGEIVYFLIVEPGDTPREVQAQLGFSPLINMERVSFGDPGGLVNSGASLFMVSKLLGHRDLASSERYSWLAQETLAQAVEAGATRTKGQQSI